MKSRTLTDFYSFYPYRKNPVLENNTIPLPYVKKSEESKHKYTLTFRQYVDIITDILSLIKEQIQDGREWKIGSGLGTLCLKKIKCRTFVDRVKSEKEKKLVKFIRNDYDNYMVVEHWERKKAPFSNKWLWRFHFMKDIKREIYLRADQDYTYLYKFLSK